MVPPGATVGDYVLMGRTPYIPYLGAWGAGAFSVLIALGGAGTDAAAGMIVVQLLANGILQQLVQPIAFGAALGIHPLAVLIVTIAESPGGSPKPSRNRFASLRSCSWIVSTPISLITRNAGSVRCSATPPGPADRPAEGVS